jgi:hypothetical protein
VLMLDNFDGIANVFEAEALPLDQIGGSYSTIARGEA